MIDYQALRALSAILFILLLTLTAAAPASAAQYAAMVIDARDGKVLHSRNADTRLHPASLTKMMTLYLAFDAIEKGEIGLDDYVTISRHAASEPPSKLGLRAGQKIQFRYLIRAAAVKSANDAATAIGEAISGSEASFARRMNRMASAMGMSRTTFKNAHGLTESGHLSTARDMTTLGRHVFYDFPEYYNLFSRRSTHAGIKAVANTNRRLLANYRGADGIKTGYTRAAGFNLVASAERNGERIIATVFGGRSTATRNARVAELLDMGFDRAPRRVAVVKPRRPSIGGTGGIIVRQSGLIDTSPRPLPRRAPVGPPATVLVAGSLQQGIEAALAEATTAEGAGDPAIDDAVAEAIAESIALPGDKVAALPSAAARPPARPGNAKVADLPVVVSRRDDGAGSWAIGVGRYPSRFEAEKALLKTALTELTTLDAAPRKVVNTSKGFEARFIGLSAERAALACRRLEAQNLDCQTVEPR